jgi:hypothetical protein
MRGELAAGRTEYGPPAPRGAGEGARHDAASGADLRCDTPVAGQSPDRPQLSGKEERPCPLKLRSVAPSASSS